MRYKSCEKIARLFRSRNAKPSADILADIARHFTELNIRWLITGEGEMLSNGGEMVAVFRITRTHSEWEMERICKPVPGMLINFIENMPDEN
ncbi:hypothetical protein CCY01nite_10100 [Chitinophaga cymbidii]|uniref:HTH cro/C1-type domain-containing protein n=2 Tax=Chitinophaga cymbidii TaxID=1096750 RepID=A0A512RGC0_9BACT|nr:hypothetical protein CCY01nite_10100 [Chitinophaga cymbidii]